MKTHQHQHPANKLNVQNGTGLSSGYRNIPHAYATMNAWYGLVWCSVSCKGLKRKPLSASDSHACCIKCIKLNFVGFRSTEMRWWSTLMPLQTVPLLQSEPACWHPSSALHPTFAAGHHKSRQHRGLHTASPPACLPAQQHYEKCEVLPKLQIPCCKAWTLWCIYESMIKPDFPLAWHTCHLI